MVDADGGVWPTGTLVEIVEALVEFSIVWDRRGGDSRLVFKEGSDRGAGLTYEPNASTTPTACSASSTPNHRPRPSPTNSSSWVVSPPVSSHEFGAPPSSSMPGPYGPGPWPRSVRSAKSTSGSGLSPTPTLQRPATKSTSSRHARQDVQCGRAWSVHIERFPRCRSRPGRAAPRGWQCLTTHHVHCTQQRARQSPSQHRRYVPPVRRPRAPPRRPGPADHHVVDLPALPAPRCRSSPRNRLSGHHRDCPVRPALYVWCRHAPSPEIPPRDPEHAPLSSPFAQARLNCRQAAPCGRRRSRATSTPTARAPAKLVW